MDDAATNLYRRISGYALTCSEQRQLPVGRPWTVEATSEHDNKNEGRAQVMPGLIRGIARTAVVGGTATAVSNRVSRRQAGRWAEQEQQAYQQQADQQAPPPI